MRFIGFVIGFVVGAWLCPVARSQPVIEELSENVFKVGAVTFDKREKTASFPAAIAVRTGAIEYLLVTEAGKAYESLLTTKVEPYDLHVAMLLMGVKGAGETNSKPPAQIDLSYLKSAPDLAGDTVEITVRWKQDGRDRQMRAEDLIFNTEKDAPMTNGPWLYNGSAIYRGKFLAQVDGSIVALVTDPEALINNPRPGHDDDRIWNIRSDKLPPEGTPLEVTFKLLPLHRSHL